MKGNMMVTVGTGKLGSMVGYRITNSNDKEKQGLRAYVAHPSNPQSFLQAQQRMKIANIARNYGTLKSVIRRAFEDKKYGGMSYLEFLRLNMNEVPEGPYVPKNYITYVPAAYKMSKGTLPAVGYKYVTSKGSFVGNLASIAAPSGESVTLAALSTAILAANSQLKDGDQLTFIVGFEYEGGAFQYRVASVTLDTTDTTKSFTLGDHGELNIGNLIQLVPDDGFAISEDSGLEDEQVCAACCILSRDGDTEHLRSTETMAVNKLISGYSTFFTPQAKLDAIRSFMAAGSEIDWPTESLV